MKKQSIAGAMMSLGLAITVFVFIVLPVLFICWVISPVFMGVMIVIVVVIGFLVGANGVEDEA